jgi:cell division protein FtsB
MERLNLQYVNEQNQKQLKNLENQVNFLNKDNRKLQEQNDFLKGDGKAVERLQQLNR